MSYWNSATIAESQILSPWRLWESERIELRAPALNFPHLQGGFPLLQGRIGGAGRREGRAVPQFRGRKEVPVQARGEVLPFETFNATSTKTFYSLLLPKCVVRGVHCASSWKWWTPVCLKTPLLKSPPSGNSFKCCNIVTFILSSNEFSWRCSKWPFKVA